VNQASQRSKSGSSNPTRAFHTARVHRAFDVIRDGLQTTFDLANQIKTVDQPRPPKPVATQAITGVNPTTYTQGTYPAQLTISGYGFTRITEAFLVPSDPKQAILKSPRAVPKPGQEDSVVIATFDLSNAWLGTYDLILEDILGNQITAKNAFTVTAAAPKISSVEPLISDQENVARLRILGENFDVKGAVAALEKTGLSPEPTGKILSLTEKEIVATFDLSLVEDGFELVVTNSDGQKPPLEVRSEAFRKRAAARRLLLHHCYKY
jgi:hypothetical protein